MSGCASRPCAFAFAMLAKLLEFLVHVRQRTMADAELMNAIVRCALCALLAIGLLHSHPVCSAEPVRTYFGLCDASAAVALDADYFAVADDEDNVIRAYHRRVGAMPVFSLDLSRFLRVDPKSPEADLEGAARIGPLVYWITSHGRNFKGKECPSRQRFFATTGAVSNGLVQLQPVGQPYTRLLQDLLADPRLQRFKLAAAAKLPPKTFGALNIEGLVATPEGHLWIGFRSPVPEGRALVVPLLNPAEVIAGQPARLGDPILLPLDGKGIRSMMFWLGQYLIIAGARDDTGQSEMYLWGGGTDKPRRLEQPGLAGLNPEALAEFPEARDADLLVVSDDGNLLVGKKPCKKLKFPMLKRFRATSLPADTLIRGTTRAATP